MACLVQQSAMVTRKIEKLTIGSLDDSAITISAQYNPKELQIDKQIPWMPHNERNNQTSAQRQRDANQQDAEINQAPTRTLTVELLFDKFETFGSVQPELDILEELSSIQDFGSKVEDDRRPHHCVVTWGAAGMPPFRCVIETLSTKLTMFSAEGIPVRATCTVKLKEVIVMSRRERAAGVAGPGARQTRS